MATAHSTDADVEPRQLLTYGVPLGLAAFVVGTLVTSFIANADARADLGFTDAAVFYGIVHGIVRVSGAGSGSEMLLSEGGAVVLIWAAVPALPLIVLGYLAVGQFEQREGVEVSGAKLGAALASGYVLAMLVTALFFELQLGFGVIGDGFTGATLDPVTAALAGVVFGGVFGGVGGALADLSRGKLLVIVIGVVLGLLNLLLYAGASSA